MIVAKYDYKWVLLLCDFELIAGDIEKEDFQEDAWFAWPHEISLQA